MSELLIKICGVRCPEMAYFAACKGADFIGVIFAATSPRKVTLQQARDIAMAARAGGAKCVGVFVEHDSHAICRMAQETTVDLVQLHGGTALSTHHTLPDTFIRILVQADGTAPINLTQAPLKPNEFVLCDAKLPGHGQTFNWTNFVPPSVPWILSGGLHPFNVRQAIAQLAPKGVDVASGVEDEQGRQVSSRIEAFILNARKAQELNNANQCE